MSNIQGTLDSLQDHIGARHGGYAQGLFNQVQRHIKDQQMRMRDLHFELDCADRKIKQLELEMERDKVEESERKIKELEDKVKEKANTIEVLLARIKQLETANDVEEPPYVEYPDEEYPDIDFP